MFYELLHRKADLDALGSGAIFRAVNKDTLRVFEIDLPPLPEQRAIVTVLSKLQAALEVQDKIVATLRELKAATMAKLFREGLVRGFMFDTHIFDKILDGQIDPSQVRPGVQLFVTHVQHDEIERCPDANRRQRLLEVLNLLNQEVVPTESAVWGVSKWGGAKWTEGSSILEPLRMGNLKHTEDALMAETCIRRSVVFVTEEKDLPNRVRRAGGEAISFQDFLTGRWRRSKQTEIGEIPESWDVVRLGDHCAISSGGTPLRDRSEYWNGSIPWVKTAEIDYHSIARTEEYITEAGLRNSSARVFPQGTLLMAMYGQGVTRGKVAFLEIEAATNQACAALFPTSELDSGYLYAYCAFAYDRIRELGHGANQKNLSADLIREIRIPLPPVIEEQRGIYSVVKAVESRIQSAEARRGQLKMLFASMLHRLMTGQVRVQAEDRGGSEASGQGSRHSLDPDQPVPASVERFVAELVRRFEPERVVLFGQHAEGSPKTESEVGLLVVRDFEGRALAEAVRIEREIAHEFSLEAIVRRPEDVERAFAIGNRFITGIVERGRVLYAAPGAEARTRSRVRPREEERRAAPKRALDEETLQEIVRRIVEAAAPDQIILFGSAARGEMGPDSDIDLLVVKGGVHPREEARAIRQSLRGVAPGIPKDVIVVSPQDVERDRDTIGYIIRPALREGKVLYAV